MNDLIYRMSVADNPCGDPFYLIIGGLIACAIFASIIVFEVARQFIPKKK